MDANAKGYNKKKRRNRKDPTFWVPFRVQLDRLQPWSAAILGKY